MKPSIYDFDFDGLTELMVANGFKKFHGDQIFQWLYRRRVTSFDDMTDLSKPLRQWLNDSLSCQPLTVLARQVSRDGTRKYLFGLSDGSSIETVLMHYDYGDSVCVTSQVGCNMGCTFCASGLLKKQRDLTSGEMCQQVMMVQKDLDADGVRLSHIVVMGTGEPFDNYDNVMRFCATVNHDHGLGIGARHITISTCGLVPGIRRFSDEQVQYNLAVSLHAPSDALRQRLMPVAKVYGLEELMDALRYYVSKNNRRLSFEYILLAGVNDTDECVGQLAKLTKGFDVYVNLIPYNSVKEKDYASSSDKQAMLFYDKLMTAGVRCTLRQKHGDDIDAACGQLRSRYERSRQG
mgnify:CR=1 FL=1